VSNKPDLRKKMLAARNSMSPSDRAEASRKMLAALTSTPEYISAKTIFCYVSTAGEPDTSELINDALSKGKRVCAPLCKQKGIMQAREITSLHDLKPGKYDIPEPEQHCPIIEPQDIDLIIVPCISCDEEGYRLGYGGGFYDRWPQTPAPRIALCYEKTKTKSLPKEPHDQKVDIIITEATLSF
jgi:5-formyltetrahydrofolate cyclo-ligase